MYNAFYAFIEQLNQCTNQEDIHALINHSALAKQHQLHGIVVYEKCSALKHQTYLYGDLNAHHEALACKHTFAFCNQLQPQQLVHAQPLYNNQLSPFIAALPHWQHIRAGVIYSPCECHDDLEQYLLLNALAMALYPRHLKIHNKGSVKITQREKQCLQWASEGKTSWEIAQILNISERTVNFHLANCITKTGSKNRQQAIVKCVLQQVI